MEEAAVLGKSYDETMYESYFALQNSPIFQSMLRYTIERNLPDLNGKRVYDNGFGAGFSLNIVLNKGLASYTGLDLSDAMVPYLTNHAANLDPSTRVRFLKGDNTEPFPLHDCDRSHFVISSYSMYVNSKQKLDGFTKHLYDSVLDDGQVLLMVIHPNYQHRKERLDILAKYGNYLLPELPEGGQYAEYAPYEIICKPPYFKNEIKFEEFVVGQETLLQSLKENGFVNIAAVEIVTEPGQEELLEFADAFNLAIYKCLKC